MFTKVFSLGVVLCSAEYLPRSLCGLFQSVLWEKEKMLLLNTFTRSEEIPLSPVHDDITQKKVCMLIRSCLARSRFCNNFVLVFSLTQHKCLHYLRYCRRCLFRETGKIFLIGTIFLEEVKKYFLFIGDQAAKLFLTA